MQCDEFQDRLICLDALTSEALPAELRAHVEECEACASVLTRLQTIEDAARALPDPAPSAARNELLKRLRPAARWRLGWLANGEDVRIQWPRLATAASVLVCVGLGIWLLSSGTPAAAASDSVVDRLVELNVKLAQASSAQERSQIYRDQGKSLSQAASAAALPDSDRELARRLAANGAWLAAHDDPVSGAERLADVADLLLQRMQAASHAGDTKTLRRLTQNYALISSQGIDSTLLQASNDPKPGRRLEDLIRRDAQMRQRLEQLLQQSPDASRQEIRRALRMGPHKPHKAAKSTAATTRAS